MTSFAMGTFRTKMVLCAALLLTVPGLCSPGAATEEVNVEKVEDIWHPIESLSAPIEISPERSGADVKQTAVDPGNASDDEILGRSASEATSDDDDKDREEHEDDGLQDDSSSPWLSGDYYYDYEYPVDEEFDELNETNSETKEKSQSPPVARVKRNSPQLANEGPISTLPLQAKTESDFTELGPRDFWQQNPARAQSGKTKRRYEFIPRRQNEEQRKRAYSVRLAQEREQPAKFIIRQRLQPGPGIAGGSSQLGYRLQAVLGGRGLTNSNFYSPSQQASKQVSATFNPVHSRTNLRFLKDSSKSDAAKVLYTLAFLSKLRAQQRDSTAQFATYGRGFASGSSAALVRPFQSQTTGSDFTQLSEIRSQPADDSGRRFAIVRLIQPLIRFVSVRKDLSPHRFGSFIEKLGSQESSAGYKALIREIQTENLKQQRFRQRLSFWRRLAQRLQQSQRGSPCISK